jgi:DNA repair protein RecO (recombination protein O)
MSALETPGIVLHAFDYLETSRIYRLATRDAGLVSALAKGARRSKRRFGAAVDLFAGGTAELSIRSGRDLQLLTGFDVLDARLGIGADIGRFTAAAVIAELVLRFGHDVHEPLYDALVTALDTIAAADPDQSVATGLAGAWHIVSVLGFAPSLDSCSNCHAPVEEEGSVPFSNVAGGVLCEPCARLAPATRALPPSAQQALRAWSGGGALVDLPGEGELRAHQRLLREFLQEHLTDDRPLRAFDVWERGRWTSPASPSSPPS